MKESNGIPYSIAVNNYAKSKAASACVYALPRLSKGEEQMQVAYMISIEDENGSVFKTQVGTVREALDMQEHYAKIMNLPATHSIIVYRVTYETIKEVW